MEHESFKKIIESDGYEISNYGNVRTKNNKIMTPQKGTGVNLRVVLLQPRPYNKFSTFFIKNLVAEYFIRKLQDGEEVTHIDGDINNNHVCNLKIGLKYVNRINKEYKYSVTYENKYTERIERVNREKMLIDKILSLEVGSEILVTEDLKSIISFKKNLINNNRRINRQGRTPVIDTKEAKQKREAMQRYRKRMREKTGQ